MKYIFVVLLGFSSLSAFACPDLSGHFMCKDFADGAVQDVVMTQAGTTYRMSITSNGRTAAHEYIANGAEITINDPDFTSLTEKSYCEGDSLKTEVHGVLKDSGDVLNAVVLTKINADNNMYDSYIGTQGSQVLNFEEVCQRVP